MDTLKETELHRSLRVLIADDRLLVRKGMQMLLSERPKVDMVCEVGSVRDIKSVICATPVDVILIDYDLLIRNREDVAAIGDQTPMIVLSVPERLGAIESVLATGASGFLLGNAKSEDLEDAMMLATVGGTFICPSIFRSMLANEWAKTASPNNAVLGHDDVSAVYHDSERWLSDGTPLERIAKALNVSSGDAEIAIACLAKLRGRDCSKALQQAVSLGVLSPGASRTAIHRHERFGKDEQE
ncbi:DNA-binding NarL/FixJ family response regulator [Chromohalobacter marismortui]|uniref:DNA-binding NarL/FixJ family response regulator n=1 Tax=Chromohalobacter marismortui TaxID=42055 RepID=A0A4R7NIG3_9GAMM|nr:MULTISPECIES: response regulator transcription factor [Chromohalobacter]MCI0510831.1 response regulator transcription factor [Chromohalobacter sp.]MCI0592703.1 response regulator transcription factor [Chromohalobacter sp.]TDU20237.1 DNA-binding NarL/FixJ family response regulator [Chromohalobacter marismortui]